MIFFLTENKTNQSPEKKCFENNLLLSKVGQICETLISCTFLRHVMHGFWVKSSESLWVEEVSIEILG